MSTVLEASRMSSVFGLKASPERDGPAPQAAAKNAPSW